jgi:multidrug transporter EmrE-like cation transporter
MTKYVIALVVALSLNAAANLMMKFGMRGIDTDLAGSGLMDAGLMGLVRLLLRNWILLLGLGCFALNVVFYSYSLQKLPISVAYPIMVTTGFVIIVVVAGQLLAERLTALQWIGVCAILLGVVCVARDAGRQMGGSAGAKKVEAIEASAK